MEEEVKLTREEWEKQTAVLRGGSVRDFQSHFGDRDLPTIMNMLKVVSNVYHRGETIRTLSGILEDQLLIVPGIEDISTGQLAALMFTYFHHPELIDFLILKHEGEK